MVTCSHVIIIIFPRAGKVTPFDVKKMIMWGKVVYYANFSNNNIIYTYMYVQLVMLSSTSCFNITQVLPFNFELVTLERFHYFETCSYSIFYSPSQTLSFIILCNISLFSYFSEREMKSVENFESEKLANK